MPKTKPEPPKPSPKHLKAAKDQVLARLESDPTGPAGAARALGAAKAPLKDVVALLMPALLQGAMMAGDGKVSEAEVRELAGLGYSVITRILALRSGAPAA